MFKTIMRKIYDSKKFNEWACQDVDSERASYNAGKFEGYCDVLKIMGHELCTGTYMDKGCSRISYLEINGAVMLKNGVFQKAFFEIWEDEEREKDDMDKVLESEKSSGW